MKHMKDDCSALGEQLCQRGLRLVTAESCTAGMVAATLGDIEGCGQWLEGAFVTYTEEAKQVMLGIPREDMQRYGLTSEAIAERMARGALRGSAASLAISNTGVAGPDDAPDGTPAGTVCFAWIFHEGDWQTVRTATRRFSGNRQSVREQATHLSIAQALQLLQTPRPARG
ncbi:CinA family protein [uncultured Herbaspirillum sp.]|uniref:CinA family protein n=1 Tax=uncultured Herbaspirillum sp. TaxID=160236 RepID=UPI00258F32D9|nr:CinA family protein [uncultured Herbaspirillum sp.]